MIMQKTWKKGFTPIPNVVFDDYLPFLSLAELKILLIVIRQTIGWNKDRDWMNIRFLEIKTGLSARSISTAIQDLIDKQLIEIEKPNKESANEASLRKGKKMLLFSCGDSLGKTHVASEKKSDYSAKNFLITKEKQNNICNKQKTQYKIVQKNGQRIVQSITG